ncbi:MAG: PadR family transcriptional regulator [Chloroflexota bacterium]|nr:MAG: PadR family transcriptional regulator [Chloroflexota bacterium]
MLFLARLEEEGYIVTVANVTVEQTKGRPLHSYEITEKGRERFHELMMNITSNVGDYQKLFLHKVQAMEHLQPADRLILLEHYINFCCSQGILSAKRQDISCYSMSICC